MKLLKSSLYLSLAMAAPAIAFDGVETKRINNVKHTLSNTGLSADAKSSAIVIAQAVSKNGADKGLIRLHNNAGSVLFQEFNEGNHDFGETVDIIALGQNLTELGVDGETHSINTDHGDYTLQFDRSYNNPIVFAQVRTYNGTQPFSVQVKSVGNNSAVLLLGEPTAYDGSHATETIDIVVIEQGSYDLGDGRTLSAELTDDQGQLTSDNNYGRNAAVVCRNQIVYSCGNSCSVDEINNPTGINYNGLRVIKTQQASGELSISTEQLYPMYEQRQACLTVSDPLYLQTDTHLTINGGILADTIEVDDLSCGTECSIDGDLAVEFSVTAASYNQQSMTVHNVKSVEVKSYAGGDTISGRNMVLPFTVDAGNDDDIITVGTGINNINAGNGTDEIFAGFGGQDNLSCGSSREGDDEAFMYYAFNQFVNHTNCYKTYRTAQNWDNFQNEMGHSMLNPSTPVPVGGSLISDNGEFELKVEEFGLNLYQNDIVVWQAQLDGNPATSNTYLEMQSNGTLALYNEDGVRTWEVTIAKSYPQLVLHDSGELAIYSFIDGQKYHTLYK